jgi:gamma-glutamylcyclotransferase (GGCT)/AIG2-like uncharacterized protein YtfP
MKYVMKAYLPNYRVEFRFYSERREGGISTIISYPGHITRGVIYDIPDEDMVRLDEMESVPQGLYKREAFLVLGEEGRWHKADLYRVVKPEGPFIPARSYIELMIKGVEEHGLAPEYRKELTGLFKSLKDE